MCKILSFSLFSIFDMFKKSYVSLCVIVTITVLCLTDAQDEEDEIYQGKYIGKINSYHHQVSGRVYAVDEYTLLLVDFNYDGNGIDTFFWAGAANRPGPQGFIVPDEYHKTNVLDRYFNKQFTLTLPDGKKITEIKWFAVYDIQSQNTFGDIYMPEEFEPPAPQNIAQITGASHDISSGTIEVLDSKTIKISEFSYDGKGTNVHFWVGVGPQASSKGQRVADEKGYLDNIRAYSKETIILELPGVLTIFEIDWLSIYDLDNSKSYGFLIIPSGLNVPPSLTKVILSQNDLPNCVQLHKDLQVSWEVFGPQVTIKLSGQVDEDDYIAFGLSGDENKSQMLGADVAIAYIDGYRGFATDYNITALSPCGKVLGQYKGVCKDDLVGGQDNNQLHTAIRDNGINIITYRRTLISADHGDKEYPTNGSSYVIWAIGKLDDNKEPTFHSIYPKGNVIIDFNRKEPDSNCFAFTKTNPALYEPWKRTQIFDRNIRTFTATVGPPGKKRGYEAITGQIPTSLAWYINGLLAPELWLRRGLTYVFRVRGGNNPHSAEHYHPLIITDEPHGGFDRLTDAAQSNVRVLAGVEFTRRGRPRPTAAGPLCLAEHRNDRDRRLDDDYWTFKKFNQSLIWTCDNGDAALLEVTPNTSWPDTVYYNSFTHANMGWKIHVVDSYPLTRSHAQHTNEINCLFMSLNAILIIIFVTCT